MGQKVRPTGFRTGIMRPWRSTWYANKQDFSELLIEDARIRQFIQKYLTNKKDRKEQRPAISDIRIDRTRERVTVVITSSRVGAIIGKKGEKIDKLTKALEKLTRRHIEVKTVEVTRPEIDPQLIAEDIAEQLERRSSFRRTMKQAMQRAMEGGAKGVKLQLSGRLGGSEMARCEKGMEGSIPLSTLPPSSLITVIAKPRLLDLAGNALASPFVGTFTTAAGAVPSPRAQGSVRRGSLISPGRLMTVPSNIRA